MQKQIFKDVIAVNLQRSQIDLRHEKKLTCNFGELVPIMCEPVLPGDTWKHNSEILMRVAPMVAPLMHRVDVYTHFFYVPNRIIWEDFESFISGGEDGDDASVHPYIDCENMDTQALFNIGTLADYLGLQAEEYLEFGAINALPFRAYSEIWNEYYRDQNLQDRIPVEKSSGNTTSTGESDDIIILRNRAYEKDYFTSALPWTQKGDDVILPLGTSAPLVQSTYGVETTKLLNSTGSYRTDSGDLEMTTGDLTANTYASRIDISDHTEVDLTNATAATINDLRQALATQRWLERNARMGTRFTEFLQGTWGVTSPDARLQRPEYLGGGKTPITISEVLNTSDTASADQGNMSGHGIAVGNMHSFKKNFTEYGWIIGIMSVMPKTGYMNGIRRHFLHSDKFEYYTPAFQNLGEQPVYNCELYADDVAMNGGDPKADSQVFGYQPRYIEYKNIPNSVHGSFRTTLKHWHLVREFTGAPSLNDDFIECKDNNNGEDLHRIFADTDPGNHKLWVQVYNNTWAIRRMPLHVTPHI